MERKSFLIVLGICLAVWASLFLNGLLVDKAHPYHRWEARFPTLGTFSSPAAADLNGDGVLDIVVGAGGAPFAPSDSAVLALDGADGRLLWHAGADAQLFGQPVFLDIDGDGSPDVLIGGRRAQLLALSGASGEVLWRYRTQDTVVNPSGYARFNFFGPRLVPDQNGDGLPDLLLANGGNDLAADRSRRFRYPGVLILLDSRSGSVIAADTMPDGEETYLLPLVNDFDENGDPDIIFGTGGETIGGALYSTPLSALKNNDISGARQLVVNPESGFIAAPVLADVNADGREDVLAAAFNGQVFALDGRSGETLWHASVDGAQLYAPLVAGRFNEDATPDVFGIFTRPHWSKAPGQALQVLIDGASGTVEIVDSIGCGGMHSAVAFDRNGDGREEVLFSNQSYRLQQPDFLKTVHALRVLDFGQGRSREFYPMEYAKNLAATPWLGDLDGDGALDIVFSRLANTKELFDMKGLKLERLSTDVSMPVNGNRISGMK